ncbi:hypothetical protein [Mycobacterium gordonae]|uniref:hypothetical protein n=1 Tax=Mycobacterium gordonae TaxID=1778 RepID=UPI00114D8A2A|nr:hypothetical protein [Mycobacterium gordonae]MCV7009490.1 hypothetical protein [Mycobacterium gordonae]
MKGRKAPLVLRVPRFDFIDETQHDELTASVAELDTDKYVGEPFRKRMRLATLLMLKPFLSAADYKVCETLPVGQLNAIQVVWREKSSIPLGEFLASADSSTENTEAQSDSTSTPEDGPAATSAAG